MENITGIIVVDFILYIYIGINDSIKETGDENTLGNITRGVLFVVLWAFIIVVLGLYILLFIDNWKNTAIGTGIFIAIIVVIQLFHWIGDKLN